MTYHSVYFVVFFVPYNIKVIDLTNYIPVVTIYEKLVELPHMHKWIFKCNLNVFMQWGNSF